MILFHRGVLIMKQMISAMRFCKIVIYKRRNWNVSMLTFPWNGKTELSGFFQAMRPIAALTRWLVSWVRVSVTLPQHAERVKLRHSALLEPWSTGLRVRDSIEWATPALLKFFFHPLSHNIYKITVAWQFFVNLDY